MEKLERLVKQKEEQFSQAQERVVELSNAANLVENKYKAAVREHKLKEAAHEEESKKLREELEASRQENRKLGQALENLEAAKLREREEAVEKAGKVAIEEFRTSKAYQADLVSQALPSYELGLRKYRAVVLEVCPDFDIKVADSRCDLSDGEDEDDEDDEEDEGREEDKIPPEAPTAEVQVVRVADEGASSEIDLEKVGSDDLPALELPPPLPEGLPEETPAPPAETS